MQGRFKMEYRLFTIVRYNYGYYNIHKKTKKEENTNQNEKENNVVLKTNFVRFELFEKKR